MIKRKSYKWWIRQRWNPQLGTYYITHGQLPKTRALAYENSLYGSNTMMAYDSEEAYNAAIEQLKKMGESVHS